MNLYSITVYVDNVSFQFETIAYDEDDAYDRMIKELDIEPTKYTIQLI